MLKKLVGLYKRKVVEVQSSIPGVSDVTTVQGWVICFIYEQAEYKNVFQRDIEQELDIRKSSATNLLQRMEKKGFIIRTPMPRDARWKKLELTQKAIDYRNELKLRMTQVERNALEGVTELDLQNFFRVTETIANNLESEKKFLHNWFFAMINEKNGQIALVIKSVDLYNRKNFGISGNWNFTKPRWQRSV